MKLEGSCHCRAVRFTVESPHPVPFNRCYCAICRKTAGSGYAVNLGALTDSLAVAGRDRLGVYRARMNGGSSAAERSFCTACGSALWLWDPRWPALVHPHAAAIDTPLPVPPTRTHLMLGSCPDWVQPDIRDGDKAFDAYPDESLAAWHERVVWDAPTG